MEYHPNITTEQRYWWRIALELKLRRCNGDAFQDFFSTVMGRLHGDDFIRVRPFGSLGDKGCDGYINTTGQLFQCYGAINGEPKQVSTLTTKMTDDYGKASLNFGGIMRQWHMVHNLVDGLPAEAILTVNGLSQAHPGTKFGLIGLDGFANRIFKLDPIHIADLLGPAASDQDAKNIDITNLRKLVADLSFEADAATFNSLDLRPVPPDKLVYNELPNHWRSLIAGGWQNAHIVSAYFDRHPEPLTGDKVAKLFARKYEELKAQHLSPGDIMASLYELVTGIGSILPQQQVAAQSLLAFLFENCDIFERAPNGTVS